MTEPSKSRQVPGEGRARYALVSPPADEPAICRFCGTDIVCIDGRWHALEARWPNLAHCHYSARDSSGVGHEPDD